MPPKKIKIQIQKCGSKQYWYNNKVGDIFEAIEDGDNMYWVDNHKVIGDYSEIGGVFKSDAVILQ